VGYQAVLFDLFDTLVLFDRTRLPVVRVNGREVHSTAGRLHAILRAEVPGIELAAFVDALLWSWQEAERLRAIDDREIPAPARFRMLFERLGLDPDALPPALVDALLHAHREALSRAMEFPPHHRALLERLAARYRLAVVSNFDYTPTVEAILDRSRVAGLFQTIVVSDAVGWRKPKPIIFEETLRRLGVGPREALFVGDRPDIDVIGAQGVAMDVAWINRAGEPLPAGIPAPQFEIRDLAELDAIVGD
jgi:putative hydrolase of the HAD superfamily